MRILIADDHQFILDSIEILVSKMPNFQVVGKYSNGKALLKALAKYDDIDMVLTDNTMPEMSGIELTYQIRQQFPNIKVILLTVAEDFKTIKEAFNSGISGYVMKKAGRDEFELALRTVASGQKYFSDSVFHELLNGESQNSENLPEKVKENLKDLSDREIEITKLIAQDFSTAEIAEKLFLSPSTVDTHRHNILKKLDLKNALGLAKFALRNGLID